MWIFLGKIHRPSTDTTRSLRRQYLLLVFLKGPSVGAIFIWSISHVITSNPAAMAHHIADIGKMVSSYADAIGGANCCRPKGEYLTTFVSLTTICTSVAGVVHSACNSQIRGICGFKMHGSSRTRTEDHPVMSGGLLPAELSIQEVAAIMT